MKNRQKCDSCGIGYKPPGRPMKYNLCRKCREARRLVVNAPHRKRWGFYRSKPDASHSTGEYINYTTKEGGFHPRRHRAETFGKQRGFQPQFYKAPESE